MAAPTVVLTWLRSVELLCILYAFLAVWNFPALAHAYTDFYSFRVDGTNGREIPLSVFRGKPSLVVNVASECGYTRGHYEDLVWLGRQPEMAERLHVLAFPCNQFGGQEPGTAEEVRAFARETYGATFPVFGKIDVLGPHAHPAYEYLIDASGKEPTWNFWKYLVDRQGRVIDAWGPTTSVREIYAFLLAATKTGTSGRDEF